MVFVSSMSDLFHEQVPKDFIREVLDVMERARWHTFQVLTKRAERLAGLSSSLPWPSNVWAGVSVETSEYLWRLDYLREVPAALRFVSLEPLLGSVDNMDLSGIGWVIAGGESGPGARPMKKEWVTRVRDRCLAAGTPFFFKQWGGVRKRKAGRVLDGRTWDEIPQRTPAEAKSVEAALES